MRYFAENVDIAVIGAGRLFGLYVGHIVSCRRLFVTRYLHSAMNAGGNHLTLLGAGGGDRLNRNGAVLRKRQSLCLAFAARARALLRALGRAGGCRDKRPFAEFVNVRRGSACRRIT